MKKIFITGVGGFVGSNLAKTLLDKEYNVSGIDNFSYGQKRNLEPILGHPNFRFHEGDVCDQNTLMKLTKGVHAIAHLAAFKIPRYGNALKTLTVNSKGTENILEAARRHDCKVLFSSTSDVYGKNTDLPFSEKSSLVSGEPHIKRWSYAVSKIFDEHLCFAYKEEYGVPISIVRYFGGYGPHQNLSWWGGPQSVFIEAALLKKPLTIHGTGKQTRSFTYISDLVEGTLRVLESDKANGEVFNIGNSREIQIIDLATMIWKMINPTLEPQMDFISYESFSGKYEDVVRRIPDARKAQELLGFTASVELEKGLPLTIEWQKRFVTA